MAKFTKNKRGYYQTAVTIGYDDNGRMIRKWLYARTISELENKIDEVKGAIRSGRNLLSGDVLFGEYAQMWYKTYKANRGINTRQMYQRLLENRFAPLNCLKVRDIRPMHLQALINEYGSMARTCEQMRMTLRQIFSRAIEDDIILKNPAASLELPRHIKKEKRPLTPEEKEAVKSADLTDCERAFLMIAYGCGLRPGEIYALTWDDIDFRKNVVHVDKCIVFEKNNKPHLTVPKTDKSIRDVEAPKIVMEALRRYRCTTIAPKLFCGRYGDYKGMTGYTKDWKRIKKKIEAVLGHETDLTLYCFRHNYCTELHYSNVSPKEAQRLLGHASYKMIMEVYAHLDAQKENTLAKLNAIDF